MRKLIIFILLVSALIQPVAAIEYTIPPVPESGLSFMPPESTSFSEDLLYVLRSAITNLRPEIAEAFGLCFQILAVVILTSIVRGISGDMQKITTLIGVSAIGSIMLLSVNSMANLGMETISELAEYGKLLLPVMTAAIAAQGSINTSAALYAGTAIFSSVLTSIISTVLLPLLFLYLCCSIAGSAIGEDLLKRTGAFIKGAITWGLKTLLYVFTGYMTITGVISGSVDATVLKATKLTISGAVPVIGNILADASDTILLSANIMKNTTGVYGLIAFIAIIIGPFIKILVQYLMIKITASLSEVFNVKDLSALISDFSAVMGFLLAMAGSVCLLLMISIICFMRGVA